MTIAAVEQAASVTIADLYGNGWRLRVHDRDLLRLCGRCDPRPHCELTYCRCGLL